MRRLRSVCKRVRFSGERADGRPVKVYNRISYLRIIRQRKYAHTHTNTNPPRDPHILCRQHISLCILYTRSVSQIRTNYAVLSVGLDVTVTIVWFFTVHIWNMNDVCIMDLLNGKCDCWFDFSILWVILWNVVYFGVNVCLQSEIHEIANRRIRLLSRWNASTDSVTIELRRFCCNFIYF